MSTTSIGDQIEALTVGDLRHGESLRAPAAAVGTPSNQAILDAMKSFYHAHTAVVDGTARNTQAVAQQQSGFVATMNGYDWKQQKLSADQRRTTSEAIFGADDGGPGLFDPALDDVKADRLFTTLGVGISADLQFFVGGAGGLGCMWDIPKREGPRGYGYVTGELGLRVTAAINVQALVTNQLPSKTDLDVYGLKVSIDAIVSLSFQAFWYGNDLQLLGFAIGAGAGLGGGATVFGGHLWNFG